MNLDHVLLWLSARGEGSWTQFRAAVEELCSNQHATGPDDGGDDGERQAGIGFDFPQYQQARLTLQRLGHVEFHTDEIENRWRVVPPTIAFLSDDSRGGLLCGARTSTILERLREACDVEVVATQLDCMPQRILVQGASHASVAACARALGFHIQRAAPSAILSALPSV